MRPDLFHSLRRSVISGLRRAFPNAHSHDVDDALSSAIECYLLDAPEHVRSCEKRSKAWLFTAAWRSLRREGLRAKKYSELPEAIEAPRQIELHADHLTSHLSDRSREIVHLHSLDGLRPREIAAMLGCSVNSVNLHLKRAYRSLRNSFRRDYAVLRDSYHYWISSFKLSYSFDALCLELSYTATTVPL
jgi:RNA polymerase sigma factor (sigma-70 family)